MCHSGKHDPVTTFLECVAGIKCTFTKNNKFEISHLCTAPSYTTSQLFWIWGCMYTMCLICADGQGCMIPSSGDRNQLQKRVLAYSLTSAYQEEGTIHTHKFNPKMFCQCREVTKKKKVVFFQMVVLVFFTYVFLKEMQSDFASWVNSDTLSIVITQKPIETFSALTLS